jgi:lipoate-protein ligase B
MFRSKFLGRIPFTQAQHSQESYFLEALTGRSIVLGFESEPVITFGARSSSADLLIDEAAVVARGFARCEVDRGGQATLHNPGQLVIYPIVKIRGLGVKNWVQLLVRTTQLLGHQLGFSLRYEPAAPGLYSASGQKVAALGLRVRKGVSTHGLAINVRNDLSAFAMIRSCGMAGARLGHLPTKLSLEELFSAWVRCLEAEVDNRPVLEEFMSSKFDVRL